MLLGPASGCCALGVSGSFDLNLTVQCRRKVRAVNQLEGPPRRGLLVYKIEKHLVVGPVELAEVVQNVLVNDWMGPAFLVAKAPNVFRFQRLVDAGESFAFIANEMFLIDERLQVEEFLNAFQLNTWIPNELFAVDDEKLFEWKIVEPVLEMLNVNAISDNRPLSTDRLVLEPLVVEHVLKLERVVQLFGAMFEQSFKSAVRVVHGCQLFGVSVKLISLPLELTLNVLGNGASDRITYDYNELDVGIHVVNPFGHTLVNQVFWRFLDRDLMVIGQWHLVSVPIVAHVIESVEKVRLSSSSRDVVMSADEFEQGSGTALFGANNNGLR